MEVPSKSQNEAIKTFFISSVEESVELGLTGSISTLNLIANCFAVFPPAISNSTLFAGVAVIQEVSLIVVPPRVCPLILVSGVLLLSSSLNGTGFPSISKSQIFV